MSRGFTLVELAVVVVIVGVLSVIAIVGYRKITLSSKITEAQEMISAIRIAEEDYKTERGIYLAIAGACPAGAGTFNAKASWDTQCGTPKWEQLAVHATGAVQFQYEVFAEGAFSGTAPFSATWIGGWGSATGKPVFAVKATSDLDPGGPVTELMGVSFANNIFSRNVGD